LVIRVSLGNFETVGYVGGVKIIPYSIEHNLNRNGLSKEVICSQDMT
jgi:hypothetical protein